MTQPVNDVSIATEACLLRVEVLARSLARSGQTTEALRMLERALGLAPARERTFRALSEIARSAGRHTQAEAYEEVASWFV